MTLSLDEFNIKRHLMIELTLCYHRQVEKTKYRYIFADFKA